MKCRKHAIAERVGTAGCLARDLIDLIYDLIVRDIEIVHVGAFILLRMQLNELDSTFHREKLSPDTRLILQYLALILNINWIGPVGQIEGLITSEENRVRDGRACSDLRWEVLRLRHHQADVIVDLVLVAALLEAEQTKARVLDLALRPRRHAGFNLRGREQATIVGLQAAANALLLRTGFAGYLDGAVVFATSYDPAYKKIALLLAKTRCLAILQ